MEGVTSHICETGGELGPFGIVAPLVLAVAEAVYEKLLSFDITAKSFVPRQTGYTGIAQRNVERINLP